MVVFAGDRLKCELSQGYTLQMKAPKANRKNSQDQSDTQDPGISPLTELSGNTPEIPHEVDALISRRQDLRGDSRQAGPSARLESQPQLGKETLRWPQWEEVEPSMLRQQVPESLAPPRGAIPISTFWIALNGLFPATAIFCVLFSDAIASMG